MFKNKFKKFFSILILGAVIISPISTKAEEIS